MTKSTIYPIYLDYAATTPVDRSVAEKMSRFLSMPGDFGNPSSHHFFGIQAKAAVEEARSQVAALINAESQQLIWTSGATESNNLAIKGVAQFYQKRGKHIITAQSEHRAVLDSCQALARLGFEISYLKPNKEGLIQVDDLKAALRSDTILVSLMHVNNETGVILDIEAMGHLLRQQGIIFHVDAAQSVGKVAIDLKTMPVDLMSFSAHKLYGPKGIGALFVNDNPKIRLTAQQHGGGQERGFRSGTLPTHQCVGMGEAFQIAKEVFTEEKIKMQKFRQQFWQGISDLPDIFLNGHATESLDNIMNICFARKDRDVMIAGLQEIAFSVSSACTGTSLDTSHVLRAMGLQNELAHRSLRFSFGRYTTQAEIEAAIQLLRQVYLQDC